MSDVRSHPCVRASFSTEVGAERQKKQLFLYWTGHPCAGTQHSSYTYWGSGMGDHVPEDTPVTSGENRKLVFQWMTRTLGNDNRTC